MSIGSVGQGDSDREDTADLSDDDIAATSSSPTSSLPGTNLDNQLTSGGGECTGCTSGWYPCPHHASPHSSLPTPPSDLPSPHNPHHNNHLGVSLPSLSHLTGGGHPHHPHLQHMGGTITSLGGEGHHAMTGGIKYEGGGHSY